MRYRTLFFALVFCFAAPLLPLFLASFARAWFFPHLGFTPSLHAYAYVASEASGVLEALLSSTTIALAVTALGLMVGIPAGRALALFAFPGRAALALLFLAPALMPLLAVTMGLHIVFLRLGLAGSAIGVVLVHLIPALPYAVLIPASVYRSYDKAYAEQARVLGASPSRTFAYVTLPMLAPGFFLAGALIFLISWSQYTLTLLIGGGRVLTLPLILSQFAGAGRYDIAGVVALLTVLPLFLILISPVRALPLASERRNRFHP